MCLNHQWKTLLERMTRASYGWDPIFPEYYENVLLTFQRCSKCSKERAFITHSNGQKEKKDPNQIRYEAAKAKGVI